MDKNLAYMFTMKTESAGKVPIAKTELAKFGSERVELFPNSETGLERIQKYGEENRLLLSIISFHLVWKEMIEGTQ